MNTVTTNLPFAKDKSDFGLGNLKQKALSPLLTPDTFLSRKIVNLAYIVESLKWKKRLNSAGVSNADKIFTYTNIRELEHYIT
jgi:hypothetical protein